VGVVELVFTAENHGRHPQSQGAAEAAPVDHGGIKKRDHQHGAEVVDDCQSRKEDLEADRHPVAQKGHHPQGESDVGRHRDAPAGSPVAAGIEGGENERRHHHAAGRRRDRQHPRLGLGSAPRIEANA
jgi:hypothetical protein